MAQPQPCPAYAPPPPTPPIRRAPPGCGDWPEPSRDPLSPASFFRSVLRELRQVKWPARAEVFFQSLAIIGIIIAVTIFESCVSVGMAAMIRIVGII